MDEEVTDLISHVYMILTVQPESRSRMRDVESATQCTLFPPRSSPIVTDVPDARRAHSDKVVHFPVEERRSPLIWFFKAVLKAIERIVAQKTETPPNQGIVEAAKTLRTTVESSTSPELNAWVSVQQASLTLRKARFSAQVADYLRRRRIHLLHKEETGRGRGEGPIHAARGIAYPGTLMQFGRRRQENARERRDGCRGNWQAQRLLKRGMDRRHRVSEPPRSKRESELTASLSSATREVDQRDPKNRSIHWLVFSPCLRALPVVFSRRCRTPCARMEALCGFRILDAALWSVVPAGGGFVSNAHRHKVGSFFFLSQHCSCRDGRGPKVTGRDRGSSHGDGRKKMKEKTKNFHKE